jgi:hypothetical protein
MAPATPSLVQYIAVLGKLPYKRENSMDAFKLEPMFVFEKL